MWLDTGVFFRATPDHQRLMNSKARDTNALRLTIHSTAWLQMHCCHKVPQLNVTENRMSTCTLINASANGEKPKSPIPSTFITLMQQHLVWWNVSAAEDFHFHIQSEFSKHRHRSPWVSVKTAWIEQERPPHTARKCRRNREWTASERLYEAMSKSLEQLQTCESFPLCTSSPLRLRCFPPTSFRETDPVGLFIRIVLRHRAAFLQRTVVAILQSVVFSLFYTAVSFELNSIWLRRFQVGKYMAAWHL